MLSFLQELRTEVSEIFHRSIVEVDESGTKAAAATTVLIKRRMGGPRRLVQANEVIVVERPFHFQVFCSDSITFTGICYAPEGKLDC